MPKARKFRKMLKAMQEYYIGKPVPKKYRSKYGKFYDKKEAKSIAFATARKKKWRA